MRSRTSSRLPLALAALLCLAAPLAAGCSSKSAGATAAPGAAATEGADGAKRTPGVLTTTGTATIDILPDMADVYMTLSVEHLRPKQAVAQLRKKQAALLEALRAAGVHSEDIRVSYLNLGPVYDPDTYTRIRGYAASITITASTKNFDLIGDIIEQSATAGVTSLSSSFRVSDLPSVKKRVRELALQAAKDNAQQTAHVLDLGLARVTSVIEGVSPTAYAWPAYANVEARLDMSAAPPMPIRPELQPMTMTVTVTWELGT